MVTKKKMIVYNEVNKSLINAFGKVYEKIISTLHYEEHILD